VLWCESCDAADIRSGDWSGDWSCDRLGNRGGEGHVIWKRERWTEKKNVSWNVTQMEMDLAKSAIWRQWTKVAK